MQLEAVWLLVDYINSKRCGVHLPDGNASLVVRAYADNSSKDKVNEITTALLAQNDTDFFLGPYSSSLVMIQANLTDSKRKVLISGGAADTAIFLNRSFTFGTFPPVNRYMVSAIEMLVKYGIKTVSMFWEDTPFTKGVCEAVPNLTGRHNMSIIYSKQVRASPNETDLYPISEVLKAKNPDLVISCVYESACELWIKAMRQQSWSPKAQIFTVCIGLSTFESKVGRDAEYMIGVTPWDKSLNSTDNLSNWTSATFDDLFMKFSGGSPTYHAASAAASLSILVQAVEMTGLNWKNSESVAKVIRGNFFSTMYGNISFDVNGQSNAPVNVIQYQRNLDLHIVYPNSLQVSSLVYPMPSWSQRDCRYGQRCEYTEVSNRIRLGTCTIAGTCECLNSTDIKMVSIGFGREATCIPAENMNYVPQSLRIVGIIFVSIQGLLSTGCIIWTKYFEKRASVQASQPIFLILIALGSFILVSSIIPLGIQGKYRYILDPITHEETETLDPDVRRLDAACMAWPWLYFLGFSLTFSSLFAKLWRIRALFQSGQSFKRKVVKSKDVVIIIIVMVGLNTALLLIWQLASPLKWQRTVIQRVPLSSVGECKPMNIWGWFLLLPLIVLEVFLLIVALVISYQIRKVPSTLAEKKWIAITIGAIFEIFVLSVPVLAIAHNNTRAFYFVRVAVIFLQGFTASLLMFIPKIFKLHFSEEARKRPEERFKRTSSSVERSSIFQSRRTFPQAPNACSAICMQCLSRDTTTSPNQGSSVGQENP
jgi:ABC-type branched-subunit amino acid transport system substrate-binding protein